MMRGNFSKKCYKKEKEIPKNCIFPQIIVQVFQIIVVQS